METYKHLLSTCCRCISACKFTRFGYWYRLGPDVSQTFNVELLLPLTPSMHPNSSYWLSIFEAENPNMMPWLFKPAELDRWKTVSPVLLPSSVYLITWLTTKGEFQPQISQRSKVHLCYSGKDHFLVSVSDSIHRN